MQTGAKVTDVAYWICHISSLHTPSFYCASGVRHITKPIAKYQVLWRTFLWKVFFVKHLCLRYRYFNWIVPLYVKLKGQHLTILGTVGQFVKANFVKNNENNETISKVTLIYSRSYNILHSALISSFWIRYKLVRHGTRSFYLNVFRCHSYYAASRGETFSVLDKEPVVPCERKGVIQLPFKKTTLRY